MERIVSWTATLLLIFLVCATEDSMANGLPVETPCIRATRLAKERLSKLYPTRIGHGWIDKEATTKWTGHRWLEYFKDNKWRVIDSAVYYGKDRGWTAEELGYVVDKYEYPKE